MARTRLYRLNDFDIFFKSVVTTFTDFRENDPTIEKFQTTYKLNICPGGRVNGMNNRVVEIFWGSRTFEAITQKGSWTALIEHGATLLYERDDSGFVVVSIYPANTDNQKPIESRIIIDIYLDPIKLKDKSFLKKHWDYFIAYMENTSLEGNPTILQKQQVSYLRTFKNLIVDNKFTPTKFSTYMSNVFQWISNVGLSGFIFYFFTQLTQPKANEVETQLKSVNSNLETISKQLGKISQGHLKTISVMTDSSFMKRKESLKTTETHKMK